MGLRKLMVCFFLFIFKDRWHRKSHRRLSETYVDVLFPQSDSVHVFILCKKNFYRLNGNVVDVFDFLLLDDW